MDLSEREDPPSSDEEDVEYKKVSTRIAGVTLESDSQAEAKNNVFEERLARRKKRMRRQNKGQNMDVDPTPKLTARSENKYMDCDGAESHISSSDDESLSGDNRDGEADDEQSDWVGDTTPTPTESDQLPFDRRLFLRKTHTSHHALNVQKRIERFAREGGRGELVLDMRLRDRTTHSLLHRYLFKYQLEIVRRQRGTVVIKRKTDVATSSR